MKIFSEKKLADKIEIQHIDHDIIYTNDFHVVLIQFSAKSFEYKIQKKFKN